MMRIPSVALLTACLLVLAACEEATDASTTPTAGSPVITPASETATVSVTPPSVPPSPGPTAGPAREDCVNGWVTPDAGTPLFTDPLGIIRRTSGVDGPWVVVAMRYFVGPESPPSDKGYILEIRRWYIKLFAEDDPAFQGRFLVESRRFGRGVAAVAPYDSRGFRSPDWIGFQYQSSNGIAQPYLGLPGEWSGTPYDFVNGGGGLDIPGLPAEVAGCLRGA